MARRPKGGCACGAVRYVLTGGPMFVHCCHCTECQCQTGSAFVLNAIYETDRIKLAKGATAPVPVAVPTGSGRPHDIYRCPVCQTALWSDYGRRPNYRFVRVGTLDDAGTMPPDVHIFTRSKLPWVELPKSARAYKVYYDMQKLWPPASLRRRAAALVLPRQSARQGSAGTSTTRGQ